MGETRTIATGLMPAPPGADGSEMPDDVPISLIGPAAGWFSLAREGGSVLIRPREPLPRRCMIRPAARFHRTHGFPDVNTVMGRLLFAPGTTQPQRYTPYTRDPDRRLCELFLPVEAAPDDDLFASVTRWRNYETVAKRLLGVADVPWDGLHEGEVSELLGSEPWHQPLEACVLHALARWTHGLGRCVIEIGSLRGQSLAMLARALRAAGSESVLISIDPHTEQPQNHHRVRLALSDLGEEGRLVQLPRASDAAWRLLKPQTASMIFIDGDHSFEQVAADFTNYRNLLVPGGCMVFHDYGYGDHNGRPDVVPGVRPAVDEHVMRDDGFQPLLLAHTLFAFLKRPSGQHPPGVHADRPQQFA